MDVGFNNLSYSPQSWKLRGPQPVLLKDVSGRFRSGELSAILGPSGAGKSTLLNALSGLTTRGVEGNLTVNGCRRNPRTFNKCSRYITQEDLLQPLLTVHELMMVSASLKLPSSTGRQERLRVVSDVLDKLGLLHAANTRTERLSGGEKKRLSIALELVNNPPVFFLDEPTSGLDNVSTGQCLRLLRRLAHEGPRTFVLTIHQPSASLFQLFDHVYVLAKGRCVYQGPPGQLVPFLARNHISCPRHYNPIDFRTDGADGLGRAVRRDPLRVGGQRQADADAPGQHPGGGQRGVPERVQRLQPGRGGGRGTRRAAARRHAAPPPRQPGGDAVPHVQLAAVRRAVPPHAAADLQEQGGPADPVRAPLHVRLHGGRALLQRGAGRLAVLHAHEVLHRPGALLHLHPRHGARPRLSVRRQAVQEGALQPVVRPQRLLPGPVPRQDASAVRAVQLLPGHHLLLVRAAHGAGPVPHHGADGHPHLAGGRGHGPLHRRRLQRHERVGRGAHADRALHGPGGVRLRLRAADPLVHHGPDEDVVPAQRRGRLRAHHVRLRPPAARLQRLLLPLPEPQEGAALPRRGGAERVDRDRQPGHPGRLLPHHLLVRPALADGHVRPARRTWARSARRATRRHATRRRQYAT